MPKASAFQDNNLHESNQILITMAREKSKKDPADYSVEEKLKNLYALQSMLSEIDSIKTLRGELPLEVQDLEDEIEGMTTRIEKITADIAELKKEISERNGKIAEPASRKEDSRGKGNRRGQEC